MFTCSSFFVVPLFFFFCLSSILPWTAFLCVWWVCCQVFGASPQTPLRRTALHQTAQNFAFFSLRHMFHDFFFLSGFFSLNSGDVLKAGTLKDTTNPQEREETEKIVAGKGKKARNFVAPHFRAPPVLAPRFRPPTIIIIVVVGAL